tara:strand:+ start:42 stop:494 length:453 start_codon:yes stop_codon:yes gene_type:complete
MKLRSDINARTAMVYAGAAFLLVIIGFKSIIATIESWEDVGILTYLSIFALVLEFALLILYAQSIYSLGPSGGESEKSGSEVAATVSSMDKGAASSLASAIDGLKEELRGHNDRMEKLSLGVNRMVKGTVQKEIQKEVSRILTKAIKDVE